MRYLCFHRTTVAVYNVLKIQRVHGWISQEGSAVANIPSGERKIIK